MDPLIPFVRGEVLPYRVEPPQYWHKAKVIRVASHTGLATTNRGGVTHLIEDAASVTYKGNRRYAARWLCGGAGYDVTLVASAEQYGGLCARCVDAKQAALYRCFGTGGELLYIGSTGKFINRIQTHKTQTPWWHEVAEIKVERFDSIAEARGAERLAILAESPLYNILPRRRDPGVLITEHQGAGAA